MVIKNSILKYLHTLLLSLCLTFSTLAQQQFQGQVYLDLNKNLSIDANEKGISGVAISNGREVVLTDRKGNWNLSAIDAKSVFIIKPSAFEMPTNKSMVPLHFLSKNGTEGKYDFPLWEGKKVKSFDALLFGDTQTRGLTEVNYLTHDIVEECIGSDAAFGVVLGDITANEPELFDEVAASIGQAGIPWYYIFGNHDHDHDAKGNEGADKTFVRNFGPSSYAFEVGQVVFISLNNIDYKKEGGYKGNFSDDQLQFVGNYLSHVPDEKLVVLMMHIPIVACKNKEAMFRILETKPNNLSISGHTHKLDHVFIDNSNGWNGATPHHHFINGTACGSWWCGMKDELGIPHATMNDGSPNGYAIVSFTGNEYNIKFKGARRPADYQMNIYLPDDIIRASLDTTKVLVNVFNGSEKSKVEMQIDRAGAWKALSQLTTIDPANLEMHNLSPYLDVKKDGETLDEVFGWKMDYPSKSAHFWQGDLIKSLNPGTHTVTIRTTDMFGNVYEAHRVFRIKEL